MKKILLIFFACSSLVATSYGWEGDFAISCSNNSWATPANIGSLNGAWKFGGSGNDAATGSLYKVLTLECVNSPSSPGEIGPSSNYYFRIINYESSTGNWYSWGGNSSNNENIALNDPAEEVLYGGAYQASNAAEFTSTAGKWYQILFQANPNAGTSDIMVLEFDEEPRSISSVSDNGPRATGQNLTVTVTATGDPGDDQEFHVRYYHFNNGTSTRNYTSDGLIVSGSMSGTSTSMTLTIPGNASYNRVSYYVFTNEENVTTNNTNADRATMFLNDNSGSHYIATLPVSLIDFSAQLNPENQIQLTWSTASEVNASHFTIHRSLDCIDKTKIGEVNAQGNSNSIVDYSFIDVEPIRQNTLYFLEQTDFDGQTEWFGPVVVDVPFKEGVTATFNKQTSNLEILFHRPPAVRNGQVTILNEVGQQIVDSEVAFPNGQETVLVNLPTLPSGVYFVNTQVGRRLYSTKLHY